MKISIVTTAFNAEEYIEETMESVCFQRGDFEIEYIVIDAMSKDATFDVIQKVQKRLEEGYYDGRNNGICMHVIREPDKGMYEGIAKGLKRVTGDIVAYINADDFYLPNAFSTVKDIFEDNPAVSWMTGATNLYNSKGQMINNIHFMEIDSSFFRKGFYGYYGPSFLQQESMFWRREVLNLVNYDEFTSYRLAGDFYLWYSFAAVYDCYVVRTLLSGFRIRDNQLSTNMDAYREEVKKVLKEYVPTKKEHQAFEKFNAALVVSEEINHFKKTVAYNGSRKKWMIGQLDFKKRNKFFARPMWRQTIKLFGVIPFLMLKKNEGQLRCKLFKVIPLFKIDKNGRGLKMSILGIPLIRVRIS